MPFVALVTIVMVGGIVGLLLFNTSMQQASFSATTLERQADTLAARQQTLKMELEDLRNPQRIAEQAQSMGMVIPANPVFLDLRDGTITGTQTPSTRENALRLTGPAPIKPAALAPKATVVEVPAATVPETTVPETGAPATPAEAGTGAAAGEATSSQP